MWIKPAAEQQFLYGHNILKSGLGRITESTTQYQGVIVFSMSDVPLVNIILKYLYSWIIHINYLLVTLLHSLFAQYFIQTLNSE